MSIINHIFFFVASHRVVRKMTFSLTFCSTEFVAIAILVKQDCLKNNYEYSNDLKINSQDYKDCSTQTDALACSAGSCLETVEGRSMKQTLATSPCSSESILGFSVHEEKHEAMSLKMLKDK